MTECLTAWFQNLYETMEKNIKVPLNKDEQKMFGYVTTTTMLNVSKLCNCEVCKGFESWVKEAAPEVDITEVARNEENL